MHQDPEKFKKEVQTTLKKHVEIINKHVNNGTYFFDYGNAFLLEASKANADILNQDGSFKYPSYVQDIMGPMCFDYGFGPFRWVCTSGKEEDLDITDNIACKVLEKMILSASMDIKQQMKDNIQWIKAAKENNFSVFSVDVNRCLDAPGYVIDNTLKGVDAALLNSVDAIMSGAKASVSAVGLKEGGMSIIALNGDKLADSKCLIADHPEVVSKVREVAATIIDGSLTLPDPMFAQ